MVKATEETSVNSLDDLDLSSWSEAEIEALTKELQKQETLGKLQEKELKKKAQRKAKVDSILVNDEEESGYRKYEHVSLTNAQVQDDEEIPEVVFTKDLIRYVAKSSDYQKWEVEDIIRHFIMVLRYVVGDMDRIIQIRGLGQFKLRKTPAKISYSGLTNKRYYVPAYRTIIFTMDPLIRGEVNSFLSKQYTYELTDDDIKEKFSDFGVHSTKRNEQDNLKDIYESEELYNDALEHLSARDLDREVTDAEYNLWLQSFDDEGGLSIRQNRDRRDRNRKYRITKVKEKIKRSKRKAERMAEEEGTDS